MSDKGSKYDIETMIEVYNSIINRDDDDRAENSDCGITKFDLLAYPDADYLRGIVEGAINSAMCKMDDYPT